MRGDVSVENEGTGVSDRVDGIPSHGSSFLGVGAVLSGLMQDRDAHISVWVHIRVPDVCYEFHLRGSVGVRVGKLELAIENTTLTVFH